jgi:hypothetical protein
VINGMFRVVHHGYDRSVTIATSAFAGCVRVARCSVDSFGAYSEPLLIEPLKHSDGEQDDSSSSASESSEGSKQLEATAQRLNALIRTYYQDTCVFQKIFGVPPNSFQVSTKLEAARTEARSTNYELSLLLVGIASLKAQLRLVHVAPGWYTEQLACVLALERFVPELDRSPVQFAPVIGQLHRLVQVRLTWIFVAVVLLLADSATRSVSALPRTLSCWCGVSPVMDGLDSAYLDTLDLQRYDAHYCVCSSQAAPGRMVSR